MKLKLILLFTMLIVSLSLLSCIVTSRDINVDISCDEFRANNNVRNDFQVEIGDKIRVKMCSNPTTGFQWEYEMSNERINHDYPT